MHEAWQAAPAEAAAMLDSIEDEKKCKEPDSLTKLVSHGDASKQTHAFCALCAREHNDFGMGWFKARSKKLQSDMDAHIAGDNHQRARDQVQARRQMGRFEKTVALGQSGVLDQEERSAQERRQHLHGKAMTSSTDPLWTSGGGLGGGGGGLDGGGKRPRYDMDTGAGTKRARHGSGSHHGYDIPDVGPEHAPPETSTGGNTVTETPVLTDEDLEAIRREEAESTWCHTGGQKGLGVNVTDEQQRILERQQDLENAQRERLIRQGVKRSGTAFYHLDRRVGRRHRRGCGDHRSSDIVVSSAVRKLGEKWGDKSRADVDGLIADSKHPYQDPPAYMQVDSYRKKLEHLEYRVRNGCDWQEGPDCYRPVLK